MSFISSFEISLFSKLENIFCDNYSYKKGKISEFKNIQEDSNIKKLASRQSEPSQNKQNKFDIKIAIEKYKEGGFVNIIDKFSEFIKFNKDYECFYENNTYTIKNSNEEIKIYHDTENNTFTINSKPITHSTDFNTEEDKSESLKKLLYTIRLNYLMDKLAEEFDKIKSNFKNENDFKNILEFFNKKQYFVDFDNIWKINKFDNDLDKIFKGDNEKLKNFCEQFFEIILFCRQNFTNQEEKQKFDTQGIKYLKNDSLKKTFTFKGKESNNLKEESESSEEGDSSAETDSESSEDEENNENNKQEKELKDLNKYLVQVINDKFKCKIQDEYGEFKIEDISKIFNNLIKYLFDNYNKKQNDIKQLNEQKQGLQENNFFEIDFKNCGIVVCEELNKNIENLKEAFELLNGLDLQNVNIEKNKENKYCSYIFRIINNGLASFDCTKFYNELPLNENNYLEFINLWYNKFKNSDQTNLQNRNFKLIDIILNTKNENTDECKTFISKNLASYLEKKNFDNRIIASLIENGKIKLSDVFTNEKMLKKYENLFLYFLRGDAGYGKYSEDIKEITKKFDCSIYFNKMFTLKRDFKKIKLKAKKEGNNYKYKCVKNKESEENENLYSNKNFKKFIKNTIEDFDYGNVSAGGVGGFDGGDTEIIEENEDDLNNPNKSKLQKQSTTIANFFKEFGDITQNQGNQNLIENMDEKKNIDSGINNEYLKVFKQGLSKNNNIKEEEYNKLDLSIVSELSVSDLPLEFTQKKDKNYTRVYEEIESNNEYELIKLNKCNDYKEDYKNFEIKIYKDNLFQPFDIIRIIQALRINNDLIKVLNKFGYEFDILYNNEKIDLSDEEIIKKHNDFLEKGIGVSENTLLKCQNKKKKKKNKNKIDIENIPEIKKNKELLNSICGAMNEMYTGYNINRI